MNGGQKGDVKNHFFTLFKIILKKLKKKKATEEKQKKSNENKKQQIRKDQILLYSINNNIKSKGKLRKENKNDIKKIKLVSKENKKSDESEIKNIKKIDSSTKYMIHKKTVAKESNEKIKQEDKKTLKTNNLSKIKLVTKNKFKKSKVKIQENDGKKNLNNDSKQLEESIIKRINKIILDNKEDINKLKLEIYEIDKKIYDTYDTEELKKIKIQFEEITNKINKIKRNFEIIKENLYFENYDEINNYFLLEEIEDFKFNNNLESVELLSLKCKQQIEQLDDILLLYEKSITTSKCFNSKKSKVEYFDKNSSQIKVKSEEIDFITKKINNNLELQNKFISDMDKKIGQSQKDVKIYYKYQGLNDLANNALMMGLGMYSYSTMNRSRFRGIKFLIGSFLIFNSIRGMLKFLSPEMKKITYIYYKDYTKELENESHRLVLTHNILNRSIQDIDVLKREFKSKFMEYQYELPEYDAMFIKLDKIQKQLKLQKQELNKIDKTLEEQKEKNKEYVKKIEKIEE